MSESLIESSTASKLPHAPRPQTLPTNRPPPLHHLQLLPPPPHLATPAAKHTVEQILEHTRQTHRFDLHGYVLMPEHVPLLLSEPTHHTLATTLKILKQEFAKLLLSTEKSLPANPRSKTQNGPSAYKHPGCPALPAESTSQPSSSPPSPRSASAPASPIHPASPRTCPRSHPRRTSSRSPAPSSPHARPSAPAPSE